MVISDLFYFRFLGRAIFVMVCLWSIVVPANAVAEDSREYHIKAAFLYHFTQFIEWPETAFSETNRITICLMGSDPFGSILEQTLAHKHVHNRSFSVIRDTSLKMAKDCHVLFVSRTGAPLLKAIKERVKGTQVLTVGETEGFAEAGGMIQFYFREKKVRFAINKEVAESGQFTISSKLLRLAKIVSSR